MVTGKQSAPIQEKAPPFGEQGLAKDAFWDGSHGHEINAEIIPGPMLGIFGLPYKVRQLRIPLGRSGNSGHK